MLSSAAVVAWQLAIIRKDPSSLSALVGVAKGTGVNGMSDSVYTSSDDDEDHGPLSERREKILGQGKTPARTELKATGAAQRLQKGKRNDPVGDEQRRPKLLALRPSSCVAA